MNITDTVAGNPRFHDIKTALCYTALTHCFNTPRSYGAALFVLHVDTFILALCSHPDVARYKNPMEPP